MFGTYMLFVFSPAGVQSLYRMREADGSFTEATRALLGLKLPPDLLVGTMRQFHEGLRRRLLETYIVYVNDAVDTVMAQLGDDGHFEVFAHMKALVHRIGFMCWVGPEAVADDTLPQLVAAFEALDPEVGFKQLSALTRTLATRKWCERRAMARIESILAQIWRRRCARRNGQAPAEDNDNLDCLHRLYAHLPERERLHQVAVNVVQFHLASQANMCVPPTPTPTPRSRAHD